MQHFTSDLFSAELRFQIMNACLPEPTPDDGPLPCFPTQLLSAWFPVFHMKPTQPSTYPVFFNDDPVMRQEEARDCLEIEDMIWTIPFFYGPNDDDKEQMADLANQDALPCEGGIVTNPLFVPSTSGPPFYAWDHMLNMWSRVTKQEIKEEPERWILHQTEAEEEEEAEMHNDEDVKSH
jgi:hypothetical protein